MIMKVKQWFAGMMISILGYAAFDCGLSIIRAFMDMMSLTGMEFVEVFAIFVLSILGFVFIPYIVFHLIKDGVQDKWKVNPAEESVEPVAEENNNEEA